MGRWSAARGLALFLRSAEDRTAGAKAVQDHTTALLDRALAALGEMLQQTAARDHSLVLVAPKSAAGPNRAATGCPLGGERSAPFQRGTHFRADFVAADGSKGFHAPQEALRLLAEAIDQARQGQVAARRERP